MQKKLRKLAVNTILISLVLPIMILFIWSLTSSWVYPNMLPSEISLRAMEYIFDTTNVKVLINSLFISFVVVFITIILSVLSAKAIALYDFRGKRLFEILVLSPIIIPTISVAMGIQLTFLKLQIANTLLGVIIINIIPCLPYGVKIITDAYKVVGNKHEVQAKMLGANSIDTFRYITFPLILPGIIGASSMCFMISFSQYFLTLIIGGGSIITYPLIMFPYIQSGDRTISSVYSLVFIVISLIVVVLIENSINKYYNKENKHGINWIDKTKQKIW